MSLEKGVLPSDSDNGVVDESVAKNEGGRAKSEEICRFS